MSLGFGLAVEFMAPRTKMFSNPSEKHNTQDRTGCCSGTSHSLCQPRRIAPMCWAYSATTTGCDLAEIQCAHCLPGSVSPTRSRPARADMPSHCQRARRCAQLGHGIENLNRPRMLAITNTVFASDVQPPVHTSCPGSAHQRLPEMARAISEPMPTLLRESDSCNAQNRPSPV